MNEEGQGQLEAYQVSDQALRLQMKDLWAAPDPAVPNMCRVKDKVLMHTKQGGREERDAIETDIMLTNVCTFARRHVNSHWLLQTKLEARGDRNPIIQSLTHSHTYSHTVSKEPMFK